MDSNGLLVEPEGGMVEFSAEKYLRYSPKQITISAGESQVVRVMVRPPKGERNNDAKEYRSHMLFTEIPSKEDADLQTLVGDGYELKIEQISSLSIPVFVRRGELNAKVSLSQPSIIKDKNDQQILSLDLDREGNRAVYGDITVKHQSPQGKTTIIGLIKNHAVYPEVETMKVLVGFNKIDNFDLLKMGNLLVEFEENVEYILDPSKATQSETSLAL